MLQFSSIHKYKSAEIGHENEIASQLISALIDVLSVLSLKFEFT